MGSVRLRWNIPAITSETFDDEIVIVNFDTGKYHSLQGSGRAIWQWFQRSATLGEVLQRSAGTFAGDSAAIERDVRNFVGTLQEEGLIVPATDEARIPSPAGETGDSPVPFTPPVLNTFSDMQDLLWLDPIHEVDETGWPVARDDGGTKG